MRGIWAIALGAFLAVPVPAPAQERHLSKLRLPSGQTVVVAEGDFEARSTGSFSVRLYRAAAAPDETTFFVSGVVRARDGSVEQAVLADVDGDERQDVVVVVRTVGTGSYLSAHAFAVRRDRIAFLAEADGLAKDADPVAALRKKFARR